MRKIILPFVLIFILGFSLFVVADDGGGVNQSLTGANQTMPNCGDGKCLNGEDSKSCSIDCSGLNVDRCGDGMCERNVCLGPGCSAPETKENCPEDCGESNVTTCPEICPMPAAPYCPDGRLIDRGEDECGCYLGTTCCGNNECDVDEDSKNCPSDCGGTTPEIIDAYLNQRFKLKKKQAAKIIDYKNMKVRFMGSKGVPMDCKCAKDEPCACGIDFVAKIQVSMPSGGNTETGTDLELRYGEKVEVFGVMLSLFKFSDEYAVLLVSKQDCPEGCICTGDAIACPACQEDYIWNPKTRKCEPIVGDCPRGCICTESTTSCPGNSTRVKGYRYAYWQCYDGTEEKQGSETSCKSARTWKKYAKEFCEKHCVGIECEEDELCPKIAKCGVNSFSLSQECYFTEDTPEPSEDESTEEEIRPELFCINSCPLEGKCYPFGYRKNEDYCSDKGKFVGQLEAGNSCDNNFECDSNVCVDGECISAGLLRRMLNWFRKLFS